MKRAPRPEVGDEVQLLDGYCRRRRMRVLLVRAAREPSLIVAMRAGDEDLIFDIPAAQCAFGAHRPPQLGRGRFLGAQRVLPL